jgi:hypothetical protein
MQHLTTGLHFISADRYHSDPCAVPSLSSTIAKLLIGQSPLHAWTASPRLNPDHEPRDSKTFDIGRAAHRAILGKGDDYVEIPDDLLASNGAASTKEAKAFIADARESGLTPLKSAEVAQIEAMRAAVVSHLSLMGIAFDPARSEVAAIGEVDGVMCRAMVDNAPADPRLPLYDLKSTTDASPEAVIRAVETYGYDLQAAHYLDTWEAATGERRKFRFVFVEKTAPFACSVVQLYDDPASEADWMLTAASKARECRRIWAECLAADHWPGYPARVQIIGARGWEQKRWADRSIGQPIEPKPSAEALRRAAQFQKPEGIKA